MCVHAHIHTYTHTSYIYVYLCVYEYLHTNRNNLSSHVVHSLPEVNSKEPQSSHHKGPRGVPIAVYATISPGTGIKVVTPGHTPQNL